MQHLPAVNTENVNLNRSKLQSKRVHFEHMRNYINVISFLCFIFLSLTLSPPSEHTKLYRNHLNASVFFQWDYIFANAILWSIPTTAFLKPYSFQQKREKQPLLC